MKTDAELRHRTALELICKFCEMPQVHEVGAVALRNIVYAMAKSGLNTENAAGGSKKTLASIVSRN